jgi:hypothetical protein
MAQFRRAVRDSVARLVMSEPPREPFFGRNAKAWTVQLAFLIFCMVVLLPIARATLKPYTDHVIDAGFDALCSATGWCTPEAADRLHVSTPP